MPATAKLSSINLLNPHGAYTSTTWVFRSRRSRTRMLRSQSERIWFGSVTSLVALLTVEYVARCCCDCATSYSGLVYLVWWAHLFFLFISTLAHQSFYFVLRAVTLNPDFVVNTSALWTFWLPSLAT